MKKLPHLEHAHNVAERVAKALNAPKPLTKEIAAALRARETAARVVFLAK